MGKTRDMSNILNGAQTSVNADKLDGQDSNFYLDHNNFVNVPEAGVDLTAFSVSIAAGADTSTLAYNNLTGVFTFTPQTVTGQTLTELKNDAETAATNAAGSATAANLNFFDSEEQAELAKDWAIKENVPVENQDYSAKYNADLAASSATAAASSASSAATSANDANTSASEASDDATTASEAIVTVQNAEANTLAYKNIAQTAATNAAASESNVSTSASNAASSASDAATQASAAATSASNASDSESNALISKNSAATSASSAATSASNAATSESNASTSASAAATSEANAAATYDNFDDRYLGSKSSVPSTDNNGDALVTGVLYFDTTDGAMKVYNGSTWLDAYASLSGALIATNNLSDLSTVSTARDNLELGSTDDVTFNSAVINNITGDLTGNVTGNLTGNVTGDLTGSVTASTVSFGDNNKAIFGAGSDLQIYHDGSNSYVKDAGTGDLYIQGTQLRLQSATGESFFVGVADGSAYVYHNGSAKLSTTATGVDVTGTVTTDGLTVDGTGDLGTIGNGSFNQSAALGFQNDRAFFGYSSGQYALIQSGANKGVAIEVNNDTLDSGTRAALFASNGDIAFYDSTGTSQDLLWDASSISLGLSKEISFTNTANTSGFDIGLVGGDADATAFIYQRANDSIRFGSNNILRAQIAASGDISFYNSAGTSQSLFWDASAERLGLGTTSPAAKIDVVSDAAFLGKFTATNGYIDLVDPSVTGRLQVSGNVFYMGTAASGDVVAFKTGANAERMRIDASGNVGIGTSSPDARLSIVDGTSSDQLRIGSSTSYYKIGRNTSTGLLEFNGIQSGFNGYVFGGANGERMRIDSIGRVGIGTSSPSEVLQLNSATNAQIRMQPSATGTSGIINTTAGSTKGMVQYNHSSDYMRIYTNGSERMRIDSSGNVGIGTSSPEHAFSVFKDSNGNRTEIGIDNIDQRLVLGAYFESGVGQYSTIQSTNNAETTATNLTLQPDGGNVGIGTSSPAYQVDIQGSSNNALRLKTSSPILRLEDSDDNAHHTFIGSSDDLYITSDAGNTGAGNMIFRNGGSSERMRIDSSGNVGIGTVPPSSYWGTNDNVGLFTSLGYLGSNGNFAVSLYSNGYRNSSSGFTYLGINGNTTTASGIDLEPNGLIKFRNGTASGTSLPEKMRLETDGDLHVDGNVVAYSTTISDIRLKKDISPIEDAVTKVQRLNGCTFTYLKDDRKSAGLIAQDLEKVLPSAVIEDEAVFHGEEGEAYKTVQYDQVIGLLVEAIKELKSEIEELKNACNK
jgi:hypothetical protein